MHDGQRLMEVNDRFSDVLTITFEEILLYPGYIYWIRAVLQIKISAIEVQCVKIH